ncbi:MAG: pyrroloquinoline quinone biosynthesis peptide chaperone PqqD [Gammaproteobacteria bacterium]|nr:pyrroloquinoline quinone biosynthesis peptide chaperone PqqD [Gammaproteobacteria bacterium]
MTDSKASTLKLATGFRLQWEPAQNAHVLLFPEGLIRLSESAAEILKRCTGEYDHDGIVTALSDAFPGVDLRSDVNEFLETAIERGWIVKDI